MSHHTALNLPVCELMPKSIDKLIILDCGFGYGMWGLLLRMKFEGDPYIIGIEKFKTYFERQKKLCIYNEIYNVDIVEYIKNTKRRFDIIICSELIEHLNKKNGLYLIDKLDEKFNKVLIFTTPYKFMRNKIGYDDNIYGKHLSGYYLKYFIKKGFKIKIIRHIPIPRPLRPIHFVYNKMRGRYAYGKVIIAYKRCK